MLSEKDLLEILTSPTVLQDCKEKQVTLCLRHANLAEKGFAATAG